jgi:hypothetical protein
MLSGQHAARATRQRLALMGHGGNGKAGINTKAKPKPMRPLSFENLVVDGGGPSPNGLVSFEHPAPEIMDFVESQLSGTQFSMKSLLAGTRIRVQNGGSAFQLDAAGNKTTIGPFVTVKSGCQPRPTSPPGLPGARRPHRRRPRPPPWTVPVGIPRKPPASFQAAPRAGR